MTTTHHDGTTPPYDALVGQQLRQLRTTYLVKQHAVAEQLGVTKGTIARWEQGTRSMNIATLLRVADLFGVPAWQLLPPTHQQPLPADTPNDDQHANSSPHDALLARITTILAAHPDVIPIVLDTVLTHLAAPTADPPPAA